MSIFVGENDWFSLAERIQVVSDAAQEVWVGTGKDCIKVYPLDGEAWWYLVTHPSRVGAYEFHLCPGQSRVPSNAVLSGVVEDWARPADRPYHTYTTRRQGSYVISSNILSVIVDDVVILPVGHFLFQLFTAASTWTGLDKIQISPTCTNLAHMFWGCSSLTTLDVSMWDLSHVQNVSGMFATDGSSTLSGSNSRLTSLTLPNNFGASATDMSYLFNGDRLLTSIETSKIHTSNVVTTSFMFTGCWRLTALDLSTFDTSNVTDMSYMFSNCTDIQTICASSSFVTTAVTNGTGVFGGNSGCPNLVGGAGTAWNSSNIDYTYAHIDGGSSNPGYFTQK